jgi:hypothetical protein
MPPTSASRAPSPPSSARPAASAPQPAFPDNPGWGARRIRDEADVQDVIAMLRLNYDRAVARHGVPAAH